MKILVTGARGLVGRNLLEHPEMQKFEVLAPSRDEMDLFKFSTVLEYLKKNKPDFIVHAAGRVGGIQANMKYPVQFLIENLDINRNIMLAARDANIRKMLNLGSSCMYPRDAENPLMEEVILKGELEPTNEGYALAKILGMNLAKYIHQEQKEFNFKTLIPCNLFGKYDKFDPQSSHLLPAIIHKTYQAMKNNSPSVEIWGTGEARREFLYAGDFADCLVECIKRFDEVPQVMNVGLGFDYSVNEYYQAAKEVIGYKGQFVHDLTKPVGMKQKLVSVEKLQKFGWKAKRSLVESLEETYQFYREHCLPGGI